MEDRNFYICGDFVGRHSTLRIIARYWLWKFGVIHTMLFLQECIHSTRIAIQKNRRIVNKLHFRTKIIDFAKNFVKAKEIVANLLIYYLKLSSLSEALVASGAYRHARLTCYAISNVKEFKLRKNKRQSSLKSTTIGLLPYPLASNIKAGP